MQCALYLPSVSGGAATCESNTESADWDLVNMAAEAETSIASFASLAAT